MPIYEYHCSACQKTFEKLSRMTETEQPCPTCGQISTKAISLPAKGQMATASGGPPPCAATCGKNSGFG
jgi:putative FmdB family regulatory protein